MPKELVFIALGSNVGDSANTIRLAFNRLQTLSERPLRCSSLWLSQPIDCPPGSASFVNAMAELVCGEQENPESLLGKLQQFEREFGRRPKQVLNEPRPLDLDLIAFGKQVRSTPELTLPHPRAAVRQFVLQPLYELAPTFVLPGQSKTVAELRDELPDQGVIKQI